MQASINSLVILHNFNTAFSYSLFKKILIPFCNKGGATDDSGVFLKYTTQRYNIKQIIYK